MSSYPLQGRKIERPDMPPGEVFLILVPIQRGGNDNLATLGGDSLTTTWEVYAYYRRDTWVDDVIGISLTKQIFLAVEGYKPEVVTETRVKRHT